MDGFLVVVLATCAHGLLYHPTDEWRMKVNFRPGEFDTYTIFRSNLLIKYFLHSEIELCFHTELTDELTIRIWNAQFTRSNSFKILKKGFTPVNRGVLHEPALLVRDGLRITIGENNTGVSGSFKLTLCRNITYINLNRNTTETSLELFDTYDSTIRIPFFATQSMNSTHYVDFSKVLPRRALTDHDWMTNGFCINSTLTGTVKLHLSRCIVHEPYVIEIGATDNRRIERYWPWKMFVLEEYECPVEEEVLPDHLWVRIESIDHSGLGEIVIYNCHHTWSSNNRGEEVIRIRPLLDSEDSSDMLHSFAVMPFRKNVYFSPLKHMMDTAFIMGNEIRYAFERSSSVTISFSACYNSTRYILPTKPKQRVGKLTEDEVHLLSEFSNVLDCPEEKRHGFYIHAGSNDTQIIDGIRLWTYKRYGAYTPAGRLNNDGFTTVAFNLKKSAVVSRNVDLYQLFDQADDSNGYTKLNIVFNATGNVKLSISRCKYSERIRLFENTKTGSFVFDSNTIRRVKNLYKENECLSDFQPERYEFDGKHRTGVYFHVEATERTIGYVAPYHTFEAKITWHQLNEEYKASPWPYYIKGYTEVYPFSPMAVRMQIKHLIERARMNRAVSLRFFIDCSGPCKFAFTKCQNDEVFFWKEITPLVNRTHAWYTFDLEGVECLNAYAESRNCREKNEAELFVQVKSMKRVSARIEFSVFNGTDLNQVNPCHTVKTVELKVTEFQLKMKIVLVEIGTVVVMLLGFAAALFLYRWFSCHSAQNGEKLHDHYQLISIASSSL